MDYGAEVNLTRHPNWSHYLDLPGRRVLLTTQGATPLTDFQFRPEDHLVFGNESAGAPDKIHASCDARIVIPIRGRSLNLSNSVAIALFDALRQLGSFQRDDRSGIPSWPS